MCEKLFLHNHLLSHLHNIHLLSITPLSNSDHYKIIHGYLNKTSHQKEEGDLKFYYKINLDKTIFHPQGGGQPSDEGELIIKIDKFLLKFIVKFVKLASDLIQIDHYGWFEDSELKETEISQILSLINGNATVECKINMEKRRIFTKIHSAGHVLDLAIALCGYEWKPARGYHFVDSPYCEYYHCNQIPESIPKFVEQLNQRINELLDENEQSRVIKTFIPYYSNPNEKVINTELRLKFENDEIPSYLPPGQDVRFVKYGNIECACSGTHVDRFSEVGPFKVSKAKKQGQTIRISYNLVQ